MNPCTGHRQFWGMLPWEFALSWCQDKSLVCFRDAGRYGHGTGLPNAPGQGEPSVPPENNSNHMYVYHSVWWQLLSSGMCLPHLFCTDSC